MSSAFINFEVVPIHEFRVTRIWAVRNLRGVDLGQVRWYGAWRKYCFVPAAECMFDHTCLRAIADFCDKQTVDHKQEARDRRDRLKP